MQGGTRGGRREIVFCSLAVVGKSISWGFFAKAFTLSKASFSRAKNVSHAKKPRIQGPTDLRRFTFPPRQVAAAMATTMADATRIPSNSTPLNEIFPRCDFHLDPGEQQPQSDRFPELPGVPVFLCMDRRAPSNSTALKPRTGIRVPRAAREIDLTTRVVVRQEDE